MIGANKESEAAKIARSVASFTCKCMIVELSSLFNSSIFLSLNVQLTADNVDQAAVYGIDPNWGHLAAGYPGVAFHQNYSLEIFYLGMVGNHNYLAGRK